MLRFIRMHPGVSIFTLFYVVAGLVACAVQQNWEFLLYVVQMAGLMALIMWANICANFSPRTLAMLSIWGLLHLGGGIIPVPVHLAQINDADKTRAVLYGLWFIRDVFKYDNLVHAFGFFAATLAVGEALRPFLATPIRPRLALFVIVASAGMGLGAVNEMIEFAATVMFPKTGVGGYVNNALDLCWNALGAAVATAVTVRGWKRPG